jgi:outer membrane biosynthesis protein TonB
MGRFWTLAVTCSVLAACGGGTPAPKDADEAPGAASDGKHGDDTAAASTDAPAPSASAAPATDTPAPAPSKPSTDLTASSDDVWMASHQMPPKDVLKTMRPNQGKVHACFSAGYKRDPSTSGEVKVKFVITNDGTVRAWKDDGSSMTDADVTKCVGDLLHGLKFPKQKSPGDAWGTYSANFSR